MAELPNIDSVLITWGDRLFYPGNRVVKANPPPRLSGDAARQRAAVIRKRIEATVVRRAPQVMVKVTGGGRSMRAIAAHFRYISKNGRLQIEDQRGETLQGKDRLSELADEWRFGGSLTPEDAEPGHRRGQGRGGGEIADGDSSCRIEQRQQGIPRHGTGGLARDRRCSRHFGQ